MSDLAVPGSIAEAAEVLAKAAAIERPVRIVGGGTKLGWGFPTPPAALRLMTTHLNGVVISEDRTTATLAAGVPLVRAQATLAAGGLLFAADPHMGLGQRPAATVGGVIATADCGPLSHRYGPPRDQLIAVTAALSDGSLVRTGPVGDHEQDGYELTRLLSGSFGTLGVVLSVDVRLHPLPVETVTAFGSTSAPSCLRAAVRTLAETHRDLQCLDVAWRGGRGGLLAQVAGDATGARARAVAATMADCGLADTDARSDDAELWARQRAGQRSADRAVMRVQAGADQLEAILTLADETQATVVGRAAQGILYMTVTVPMIATVRAGLPAGTSAVVLDLPAPSRGAIDPWGTIDGPELDLMRGLKARFDPAGICNPGLFVGRI